MHFRERVSVEEQRAQKDDRFLRGRQIAYIIYEYFFGSQELVKLYKVYQIYSKKKKTLTKWWRSRFRQQGGTMLYQQQVKYPRLLITGPESIILNKFTHQLHCRICRFPIQKNVTSNIAVSAVFRKQKKHYRISERERKKEKQKQKQTHNHAEPHVTMSHPITHHHGRSWLVEWFTWFLPLTNDTLSC